VVEKGKDDRKQNTLAPVVEASTNAVHLPRNLSNHMGRQARTRDTVIVKSREMTGRSQTLPLWLGGDRVKTTETKTHWPRR
jgi:hypothetical protein